MIRSATEPLKARPGRTAVILLVFALAMVLPGSLIFASSVSTSIVNQWLADFEPVVYLHPTADQEAADELAAEIEEWSEVETVDVRGPKEGFELAKKRVGKDRLTEVGVDASMFPHSMVIESSSLLTSNVDLVARLTALETRETVDVVDVASDGAKGILVWLDRLFYGGLAMLGLALAVGLYLVGMYLRELRRRERSESALLERFGATPGEIRRVTFLRGVVLGLWSGIASTGVLLVLALGMRAMDAGLFGSVSGESVFHWIVVGAPMVVGPLAGGLVGMLVARSSGSKAAESLKGVECMVDYS